MATNIISAPLGQANPARDRLIARLGVAATTAKFIAEIRAHNARKAEFVRYGATDEIWSSWNSAGWAIYATVESLPNTAEYLPVRALAVGSGVDETDNLANLSISDLVSALDAPDQTLARIVRQMLACAAEMQP